MFITGKERYEIRRLMLHTSGNFRAVYALSAMVVDCTTCGYDAMSDSGLDPTCPDCDGTGRVISWSASRISARIKVFDFVELQGAGAIPPGVELGDIALYVRRDDKGIFADMDSQTESYVKVDGDSNAYRPFSVTADGVGQDDEVRVLLRKVTIERRKEGY